MFKVICIDHLEHHPHLAAEHDPTLPEPEIGEECEVIDTKIYKGVLFYRLAGYGTHGYDSANYAPLDGPCEKERLEAWQEEHMTEADRVLQACADMMPEVELPKESFERIWQNINRTL